MQFHLDGFEPGDPEISDPAERFPPSGAPGPLPEEVDVFIVGCGPAGLTLATQLSAFPDIKTCIVDQKPSRLARGQADGIACRTVEMFHGFGFSERLLKEAYWVNERRSEDLTIGNARTSSQRSGPGRRRRLSGVSRMSFSTRQVHDFYLDTMRKSPARLEPYYARRLLDLEVKPTPSNDTSHQVTVRLERLDPSHEGQIETVKARYVVGCDGARSIVRKGIGRALHGDSANHAWGVMDVLAVTDFPDIRFKSLIQSDNDGSIIVIPRGRLSVSPDIELDSPSRARVSNLNITPRIHRQGAANSLALCARRRRDRLVVV